MNQSTITKNIVPFVLCMNALTLAGCGARSDVKPLPTPTTKIQSISCASLDATNCQSESACLATYEHGPDCFQGPCPEVSFLGCIDQPALPPECPDVACQRACAFGMATGADGCSLCACLPPSGPCEEMNQAQCEEASACRGLYVSRSDSPGVPCRDGDPDCGPNPEPNTTEFVGCSPRPAVTACNSHADCPGGVCEFSRDSGDGHGRRIIGQCVDLPCSDDSVLVCDAPMPLCEFGARAAIRNGCWACIDDASCETEVCREPDNAKRAYISRDDTVCGEITADFRCGGNSQFFNDACGCGCEVVDPFICPPASEDFQYISRDPEVCERIDYTCPPEFAGFLNECGCGCERPRNSPTPLPAPGPDDPQIVTDCGEGIQPLCEVEPPNCPAGTLLTVRNECWACIAPDECRKPPGHN